MHSTNTRVILLRHGQSTYNALGLYQGSSDRPNLTELGYQQAQLTGTFLNNLKFDAIYASPLKRAQDTVKEIFKAIDPTVVPLTINTVSHLRETDLPAWQGLPFQCVKEQFPENYRTWKQRPHEFCMTISQEMREGEIRGRGDAGMGRHGDGLRGKEEERDKEITTSKIQNLKSFYPALDLYDRIQQFWQEILPRHVGETILIVCHGGTNRALISTALEISPAHYHCIEQSNCALSVLDFPNGRLESGKLAAMNHATHVGETFPQIKEGLQLLLISSETENLEQTQKLAHFLKDIKINFSISSDRHHASTITQEILQHHSTTIQLQVLREEFPQLWQQAIRTKDRENSTQSLTGLIVGCDRLIQQFLAQVLGIDSDNLWRLQLQPGTVSSIYYPNSEHLPILQKFNLGIRDGREGEMG
jgi:phosphoserine phosphatase